MSVGIVIGAVVLGVVVAWVLRPLLAARQPVEQGESDQQLENLLFEREAALVAIRDLQLDHDMGKLSDEDFAVRDARYRAHAIAILRQLDALGVVPDTDAAEPALDAWIERAVREVREGRGRAVTG